MNSKWYSGYYKVAKTRGLHYLFIESLNNPEKDPIMVFFNGGPGGSSLDLQFAGMGPVYVELSNGTLSAKNFNGSFCNNASVIFLDNPAMVGYSFGTKDTDKNQNDFTFQHDALSFIEQFFNDFPEYLNNDFYVGGASYGGIYAPGLAWAIHHHNQ
jgi:carboxypeptidase C (cathepsin A)